MESLRCVLEATGVCVNSFEVELGAAGTLTSLDEYLNTSYRPDLEFVDGVLVKRNVGTQRHGLLQSIVVRFFGHRNSHRIGVNLAVRLRINERRYRIRGVLVLEKPYTKGIL